VIDIGNELIIYSNSRHRGSELMNKEKGTWIFNSKAPIFFANFLKECIVIFISWLEDEYEWLVYDYSLNN